MQTITYQTHHTIPSKHLIFQNGSALPGDEHSPGQEGSMSLVRCLIFLLTGLVVGLSALAWAARTLHQHRRSGGKVSVFIVTLLFTDALELLLLPLVVVMMTAHCGNALFTRTLSILFFVVRFLGLNLHQLVALEDTASFTHPGGASVPSSLPCSLALLLSMLLPVTVVIIFSSNFHFLAIVGLLLVAPVGTNVAKCVLICSARAAPHITTRGGRPDKQVMAVSLITFLGLYGPYFLTLTLYMRFALLPPSCASLHGFHSEWETLSFSMMSLRVVADPLLCVLVCKSAKPQVAQRVDELSAV